MGAIKFIDTSIRDGNQSLWDATGLMTGMFLDLAPIVDRNGFKAVDFVSNPNMEIAVSVVSTGHAPRTTINSETNPFNPGKPKEAMEVKISIPP